jgi:predicted adenylyl cyclase CyaB
MSKEIEKRFFNFDRLEIEKILKELGAVKKGIFLFKVVQFKGTFPIITLRLRDEGYRITFTIKEKTNDYDLENEVIVNNFNEMRIMINKLGIKEKYSNEKIREIYNIDDAELIFDHWPGLPGYIEIEASTEEKLIELANKFGLDMNEKPGGFSQMYQELYQPKIDDIAKLNISFNNVNETIKPLINKNMDLFEKIVEGQKKLMEKVNK